MLLFFGFDFIRTFWVSLEIVVCWINPAGELRLIGFIVAIIC